MKTGGVGDIVTGTRNVASKINTITHADDVTVLELKARDDMIELIK
jgi:hypothetical protein